MSTDVGFVGTEVTSFETIGPDAGTYSQSLPAPVPSDDKSTFATREESDERERKSREARAAAVDARKQDFTWITKYREVSMAAEKMTAVQRLARAVALKNLYSAFDSKAIEVAKLITSEIHLPPAQRTLKPIAVPGLAGGEKFIVEGVLYKFARDWRGIYGGDEFSAKAAGHELRGVCAVMGLHVDLNAPLMTIVDVGGYRVVALSLLPIDSSTLVCGSDDGGKTVVSKDAQSQQILRNVAAALNLKEHVCSGARVCVPGDLEVHVGFDGARYVVDTARLFPPEATTKSALLVPFDEKKPVQEIRLEPGVFETRELWEKSLEKQLGPSEECGVIRRREAPCGIIWSRGSTAEPNRRATALIGTAAQGNAILLRQNRASALYRLLRPELVKSNSTPLCSDAFTRFIDTDERREEHNSEVAVATRRLLTEVIPALAEDINMHRVTPMSHEELAGLCHARGVNIRMYGRLRKQVNIPHLRSFILSDMISRVLKESLRATMRELSSLPDSIYRREIVEQFNLIFGNRSHTLAFWSLDLKARLALKFVDSLTAEEAIPDFDLRNELLLFPLFQRVCKITGVVFKKGAQKRLFEHPFLFERETLLTAADLEGIIPFSRNACAVLSEITDLIRESVVEEEQPTMKVLEQVGEVQALSAIKAIIQLKIHRRIETILGADSAEAITSYFALARRHMISGSLTMALDSALRGASYSDVLFGTHSEASVQGAVLLGKIYERMGDLKKSIQSYQKALEGVSTMYKQHPLVGTITARLFFCTVALSKTSTSAASSQEAFELLKQSVRSFANIFGSETAMLLLPLIGFDQQDSEFVRVIQESMQEPDSHGSLLDITSDLWPNRLRAMVRKSEAGPPVAAPAPVAPEAASSARRQIAAVAGLTEDALKKSGFTNPTDISRVMNAVHILQMISSDSAASKPSSGQPSAPSTLAIADLPSGVSSDSY